MDMLKISQHYLHTTNAEKYGQDQDEPRWHEEEEQNEECGRWYDKDNSTRSTDIKSFLFSLSFGSIIIWRFLPKFSDVMKRTRISV